MLRKLLKIVMPALALSALLAGCGGDPASAGAKHGEKVGNSPVREVRLANAQEGRLARTVAVSGTLAADEQAQLGFKVAGRLERMLVDIGTPVRQGQVVIEQNANDRTVYIVESGQLTVHYEDDQHRLRLATVEAGSAVGEGAFFTRQPRTATVQAASTAKLWSLSPIRFTELTNRQPQLALEVAMALGSLVSRRLANRPKRVAVT